MAVRVLGQANPAATTNTDLYTVAAGKAGIISTLAVCNRDTVQITYRVAIRPAGAVLAVQHYVAYDVQLPAKSTDPLTWGMTLAATDVITVYASTANVSFSAFGDES